MSSAPAGAVSSPISDPAAPWLPWAALIVVYVFWGSTYLAIRVGVETIPPFMLAGLRYLAAGLLLYPAALRIGGPEVRRTDRPGRRQWFAAAALGVVLLTMGNGGLTFAETDVDSGVAALLVATVPLWMLVADWAINSHPITSRASVALFVGLFGNAVLVRPDGSSDFSFGIIMALVDAPRSVGVCRGRERVGRGLCSRAPVGVWVLCCQAGSRCLRGPSWGQLWRC